MSANKPVRVLIAYAATLAALVALDLVWLRFASDRFFRPAWGDYLASDPNIGAAALFYIFFSGGLIFFCVLPAAGSKSLALALLRGALLGFLAYMTFDLTNLAIMKAWPLKVALIDMSWGTFASALSAAAGFLVFGKP